VHDKMGESAHTNSNIAPGRSIRQRQILSFFLGAGVCLLSLFGYNLLTGDKGGSSQEEAIVPARQLSASQTLTDAKSEQGSMGEELDPGAPSRTAAKGFGDSLAIRLDGESLDLVDQGNSPTQGADTVSDADSIPPREAPGGLVSLEDDNGASANSMTQAAEGELDALGVAPVVVGDVVTSDAIKDARTNDARGVADGRASEEPDVGEVGKDEVPVKKFRAAIKVDIPSAESGCMTSGLRGIVLKRRAALKRCVEKELVSDPHLNGHVTVRFVMGHGGRARSVRTTRNTSRNRAIGKCFERVISKTRFATSRQGCAFSQTLGFKRK